MPQRTRTWGRLPHLKHFFSVVAVAWTVVIGLSLAWSTHMVRQQTLDREGLSALILGHSILWLIGFLGIAWSRHHIREKNEERSRAEEAMLESESRFREMAESIPLITVMLDLEGRVTFCNDYLLELTGHRREDVIGRSWFKRFLPEDERGAVELMYFQRVLSGRLSPHYENEIVTRSGERRLIAWKGTVIRDRSGTTVGATAIGEDITLRERAQMDLRASEERYRSLMEKMLDGFALHEIICDGDGRAIDYRFLDVNPSFERLTGLSRGTLIGATVLDVLPGTEPIWIERYGRVALTGEPVRFEAFHGELGKWFEIVAFRPEPNRFACIFQDISQRKEAEEELKASEERLRMIFENAPDPFYLHDLDGRFVDGNLAAEKVTGYSRDELIGRTFMEAGLLQADELQKAVAILARSSEGRPSGPVELNLTRKDGGSVCLETSTYPTKIKGQPMVLGIARDITERKRAEKERTMLEARLRQSQKMEAIGTLAGGIAHDFNNILAAILGYSELALLQLRPGDEVAQFLEEIKTAGCRARDVVRQILTFSRHNEKKKKPVRMGPLVMEIAKLVRASIPSSVEIDVSIRTQNDWVMADATQMHQVLMNLCTNAWQAMTDGKGLMTIGLSAVEMCSDKLHLNPELKQGPHIVIEVSDTGCGIPAEIRERIFEPYFSTKRRTDGTGLGLAVVQGIVKSHGGSITVESGPGAGSVFSVLLPLQPSGPAGEPEGGTSLVGGRERILCVDDEPALAEVNRRTLGRLGYTVTTRVSSAEALELFQAQHEGFDLVITDHAMPRMTGTELARELSRIRPDIPIIILTGLNDMPRLEKMKGFGVKAILLKPLDAGSLSRAVRQVLDEAAADRA